MRMGYRRDLGMGIQGRSQDGIKGRTGNQLSSVYRPDKDQKRLTANSSQVVLSTLFLCNESSFCYIQVNLLDLTTNYVLRTFSGISCPFYFNDRIIEIEYTYHKIPFLHGKSLFFLESQNHPAITTVGLRSSPSVCLFRQDRRLYRIRLTVLDHFHPANMAVFYVPAFK